ncbi:hypothetical protein NXG27_00945 [Megasphaera paucivorans]|uniref:SprT-like family protein n=1 Tax=Megasphaera paucivorans TaxID=349095 RepID=A0A1G9QCK3_9FIRM|nr:hypothetical protein [Megasphaera paucivorans]SDM08719.1 hypothetical protein SAMN05660299_00190 [Megasphaera paucivorans]
MTEPIIEFTSIKQAYDCLHEWQNRLFLDDWIIKLNLLPRIQMTDDDAGHNTFQITNKASVISICIPDDDAKSRISKFCQELILVHELLHLKYNLVDASNPSYEEVSLMQTEHMLLEQMAKSLIMAKYNLQREWFINFKEDK